MAQADSGAKLNRGLSMLNGTNSNGHKQPVSTSHCYDTHVASMPGSASQVYREAGNQFHNSDQPQVSGARRHSLPDHPP